MYLIAQDASKQILGFIEFHTETQEFNDVNIFRIVIDNFACDIGEDEEISQKVSQLFIEKLTELASNHCKQQSETNAKKMQPEIAIINPPVVMIESFLNLGFELPNSDNKIDTEGSTYQTCYAELGYLFNAITNDYQFLPDSYTYFLDELYRSECSMVKKINLPPHDISNKRKLLSDEKTGEPGETKKQKINLTTDRHQALTLEESLTHQLNSNQGLSLETIQAMLEFYKSSIMNSSNKKSEQHERTTAPTI
jgi:hypothetical protein